MKKTSGYIVMAFILIAVGVLIYVIATKGIGGNGTLNTSQTSTVNTSNTVETAKPSSETSNSITSSKITLTITSPINGATLNSTNATVKGKTTPNADVFVNDVTGRADSNGNFSISIGLDEGENLIVVSANDSVGNATQQEMTVTVASF